MEYRGHTFTVEIEQDADMREPWKEHDGHGIITEWTNREKAPGERVLVKDRTSCRFYDVKETLALAKKDGWGMGPEGLAAMEARLGRKPTKKEIIAEVVENDFKNMQDWCNDRWYWVGVVVTLKAEGKEYHHSLWGIESNAGEYLNGVALELADECLSEHNEYMTSVLA